MKGPMSLEESNNNVEVFPSRLSNVNTDDPTAELANVEPLQESSCFGVEVMLKLLKLWCRN